jgi:hypothetical protein
MTIDQKRILNCGFVPSFMSQLVGQLPANSNIGTERGSWVLSVEVNLVLLWQYNAGLTT